jgi:glycosyltransferase involved in cell wall biosynthesis
MGGAETWLMELLRFWSRTGSCQIDFLATSGNPGIFDDEARALGATIHYLPYGRVHLSNFAKNFRRILRQGRYDAIHDHQDYASGWHFLLGSGALPRVRVTHVHNPWLHIESNYSVSSLRRFTATVGKRLVHQFATDICGTSAEILCRYGFNPTKKKRSVHVVHCGFEVARFNKSPESDRTSVLREFCWPTESRLVLFVGRLDRALKFNHPQNHKNSWFAVQVVRAAVERQPTLRFLMAGAGDGPRKELEKRIEQWGLEDRLRLVGVRDDVARLMRAADVLFFPSRQEGLGMVAVEAQAAGLPVLVSTAVPRECVVIPELVHALPLSEPLNRWADTLLEIMTKPRLPVEICRYALETSAFAIQNSARRLEQIYKSLLL